MEGASVNWTWGWPVVVAIATPIILVFGLFFTLKQLIEVRKGRNSQLAAHFYQSFRTNKSKEILARIYQSDPSDTEATLATLGKEDIERILDNIGMIGTLVASGTFDKTLAVRIFAPWPIRCWSRLSGYIEKKRNERGHYYAKYVEDFTKRCIKYQIENDPKDEWVSLTMENKEKENLVDGLKDKLLSRKERYWAWFVRYLKHPCWLCKERFSRKAGGEVNE